jgi:hypothetical protein
MRRYVLFAVAGLATILQGCNCAGREFTLTRTFSVHATSDDPLCQTNKLEVDLGKDQAFTDARAFISRVELRKLAVKVSNPKTRDDSVVTRAHGSVQVAASQTATTLTLGTYSDVPIAADSGQDITIDKAAADELARLALTSPNVFWITGQGCNDRVPAFYDFDVLLTLYAGL